MVDRLTCTDKIGPQSELEGEVKIMRDAVSGTLRFLNLSDRHHGITPAVSASYAEAACVCLDRHHTAPVHFHIVDNSDPSQALADWPAADDRSRAAWNNATDATEAGACAIALAAIECSRGLVAISRAETATGADYYVDTPESDVTDLETSFRLEISGTDSQDRREVERRLARKIKQTVSGNSNLPAIACVVGFVERRIAAADAP